MKYGSTEMGCQVMEKKVHTLNVVFSLLPTFGTGLYGNSSIFHFLVLMPGFRFGYSTSCIYASHERHEVNTKPASGYTNTQKRRKMKD